MPEVIGSPSPVTTPDLLLSFRSEIDAVPEESVLSPRVDVAAAALTAIGAMPEIEAQRALITSVFRDGSVALDRLAPVARALLVAHATFTSIAERDLEPAARELMDVRARLFTAASALIERGLVHRKSLSALTGGQSYQARVVDTMVLVSWFRTQTSAVRAHTKVDDAELEQAQALADEFGTTFAERDQARAGSSKSARDRARMFTLFFRTYERVRQLLTYVRWHEADVEEIAPSIYAGRGPRKQGDVVVAAPTDTTVISPGLPGADPFRVT